MTFLIGWISCAIGTFVALTVVKLFTTHVKFTWKEYVENFFFISFIYGLIQVWIGG